MEVRGEEDMIENNDKQEKTVVRLYFVQPKSFYKSIIFGSRTTEPQIKGQWVHKLYFLSDNQIKMCSQYTQ